MRKLGFILRRAFKGDGSMGSVNESGSWSRYVSDLGSYIDQLDGFETSRKGVVFLRFLGREGYFVTFIRTIQGGRGGDHIAGWVHFPVNLDISRDKMEFLIDEVEQEMESQSHSSEFDGVNWRKIFDEEYDTKKVQNPIVGSIISKGVEESASIKEKEVAGRYYGNSRKYSLCELLVDYIAQPEYKNYSGIFLIDSQSGVTLVRRENEITTRPRKNVTFTLSDDKDGFKASYVDISDSGRTIEVLEGEEFSIKWSKRGYKDIKKKIIVDVDEGQILDQAKIEPSEKQIIVRREWFKVLDADGKDISPNSKISINGNEFKDNVLYVTEVPKFNKYRVEFSCKGYKAENGSDYFEKEYDRLPSDSSATIVRTSLRIVLYNQKFQLPSDQGNDLKYNMRVVVTSQEQTNGSPFKGYAVTGDPKELRYVGELKNPRGHAPMWKNPMFYVVCAIVALVFMACGFGVHILIEKKSSETEDLRVQINSLTSRNTELTDSVDGLREQINERNTKIQELEDRAEKTNTEKDKEIGNLRDSIAVLNGIIDDKDKSLAALEKEKSDLVNENERLRNQRNEGSGEKTSFLRKIFRSKK